jgi:hypothetical protein
MALVEPEAVWHEIPQDVDFGREDVQRIHPREVGMSMVYWRY